MKKAIFFFAVVLCSIISFKSYSDTLTLSSALKNKLITLNISGADKDDTTGYYSRYTGDCMEIEIINLSGKSIKVYLEAGRFFEPEDTTIQRMIVTREQMIALEKGSKKKMNIYAMCSQMNNSSPKSTTSFILGKMAEGKLLELAQLISKNNFQGQAAQSAIWALTDNNDLYDIYSDNASEMIMLKNFVRKAKGLPENAVSNSESSFELKTESPATFVKYGTGTVSGSFQFKLKKDTPLNLFLYNEKGELARKSLENQIFKSGQNTLKFEFHYTHFPVGNYRLKMFDKEGNVLINKLLRFQ